MCIDPSVHLFEVLNVLADHMEHMVVQVARFLFGDENKLLVKLGIDADGEFFLCFHGWFLSFVEMIFVYFKIYQTYMLKTDITAVFSTKPLGAL